MSVLRYLSDFTLFFREHAPDGMSKWGDSLFAFSVSAISMQEMLVGKFTICDLKKRLLVSAIYTLLFEAKMQNWL